MTTMLQCSTLKKPLLSNAQKTFNRLKKKLEKLQHSLQTKSKQLDTALQFYHEHVLPQKLVYRKALRDVVKLLYSLSKTAKILTKKEKQILRQLLLDKCDEVCYMSRTGEFDEELQAIFQELNGISYEDVVSEQFQDMKSDLNEMFKEMGVDVDFSSVKMTDSEPEIIRKMFESMQASHEKQQEKERPKSKKQLQKEQKAQELENLQKNGLNGIYKQLAKALHPDLEQCQELKKEKEHLMKQLTAAYENNDLHTMLSIQMQWLQRSDGDQPLHSDEQIKLYNSILKDQIDSLEMDKEFLSMNPKYAPLEPYQPALQLFGISVLHQELDKMEAMIYGISADLKRLQGPASEQVLRDLLKQVSL
jgi:hypothetical protein